MLKLEAEVGPVKYIAALAVDFGITDNVDTSEAVRWVILIIICVFDPLAVLLLIAANQSFIRRFPPEPPKPQEVIDLEKPDEEDVTLKWNDAMNKKDAAERMEQATEQLKEWKEKLEAFNNKVEKPETKPIEIIQEDNDVIPHIDLKGQKKTEDKEKVTDNMKDGFDPDEVMFDLQTEPEVDKEKQLEAFKKREEEEKKALERIAEEARKEEVTATVEEALKMSEAESVETPIQEERIKPDLTEVIEPEVKIESKDIVKNAKPRIMRTLKKEDLPPKPILSNWQRAELLDNFHKEHGNFEDVSEYVQNAEQSGQTNWKKIKTKTTTEEDYHSRMEKRIEEIMEQLDAGEKTLEDLTPEDKQVIIEIRNQDKV